MATPHDEAPAGGADDDENGTGTGADEPAAGLSDLVKRAMSAGLGAARASKEEVVRAAATEMRGWLDHLDLDKEIARALRQIKIEIKTSISFHAADDGDVAPRVSHEAVVKKP